MTTPSFFSHPSSEISENALIGEGTKIWHYCHVMDNARIGKNCIIGQNVFVAKHAVIGNGVKIQNNVSVYQGVHCDDEVFIGPSVVFTNVINPRGHIERKAEFQDTFIEKGATIGANATILCGIRIGKFAMVGAGAVVLKDVPDYAIVIGNPAFQSGWTSTLGVRLYFDMNNLAICKLSGDQYILKNAKVEKVK